jgi:hypothetical protein
VPLEIAVGLLVIALRLGRDRKLRRGNRMAPPERIGKREIGILKGDIEREAAARIGRARTDFDSTTLRRGGACHPHGRAFPASVRVWRPSPDGTAPRS